MRWPIMHRTVLSGGAIWLAVAVLLSACEGSGAGTPEKRVPMAPISFNEIAGWADLGTPDRLAVWRRIALRAQSTDPQAPGAAV